MGRLVNDLIRKGYLKEDIIIDAFSKINRIEFVPSELEIESDADFPFPIGYGQTISQPLTVAFMLELLAPQGGQNILDVGSGSGWTTGLLSYIVGEKGKVTALEIIPELFLIGKNNVDKFGYVKKGVAEFYNADGSKGYSPNAPYDRILVSAAAEEIPEELKKQLKIGGKMVIPIHNDIWYVEKESDDDFRIEQFPGFSFVPLITKSN